MGHHCIACKDEMRDIHPVHTAYLYQFFYKPVYGTDHDLLQPLEAALLLGIHHAGYDIFPVADLGIIVD